MDIGQGWNHKPKPYRVALLWRDKLPTTIFKLDRVEVAYDEDDEEKKELEQRQIGIIGSFMLIPQESYTLYF